MQQFGRVIQLVLGNDKESIILESPLTITFAITKSITQDPNECTIEVTNLSQSTRNLISDKAYNRVLLNAGYGDDLRTLFVGYVDQVETNKQNADITTTLTCVDGAKDYREARVAVTVAAGQNDATALGEVMRAMPNTEAGSQTLINNNALPRGKVLVGNARDVLKGIALNQDADWSIQDGKLVIIPKTHALANNEGFLLSEGTGMIGTPQKNQKGLEVRCLLNNIMRVGQLCRVESKIKEYSGDFKIIRIEMRGTNRGQDFLNVLQLENGQYHEISK